MLLIPCPWCGPRDDAEFAYGNQAHIVRPADPLAATDAKWAYNNPQGENDFYFRATHAAAQAGQPWQNGKQLLSAAGSRSLKMVDVFKSKPEWRELIQSDRRGNYRLRVE